MPDKKFVMRKFQPKTYYKVFDWEAYTPEVELKEKKKTQKKKEDKVQKIAEASKKDKKTVKPKVDAELKKEKKSAEKLLKQEKKSQKAVVKSKSKAEDKKRKLSKKSSAEKVRYSIGIKLIVIISLLMCFSMGLITVLVSYFVSGDTRVSAEDNNLTINTRTAADTESRFNNVVSSVGMLLDLFEGSGENIREQKKNAALFFERNSEIAAVILPSTDRVFVNNAFFTAHEIDTSLVENFQVLQEENIDKARNGNFVIENVSNLFTTPVLALIFPIYSSGSDDSICVIYSSEALAESFSSGSINQSFLVNAKGEVLIHSDIDLVMNSTDLSDLMIVQKMMEESANNSQLVFEEDGEEYLGAYKKLAIGDGAVITMVKTSVILGAVNSTTRRNIYLTFAILSISILIIYFFGKTLSNPLKELTMVTNEINKGNFTTSLLQDLNEKRGDEIGVLIKSTKNEQNILQTFTKLTNKGVTKAIIRKKIDFDPHLKDITIFFSDIRGFTAISDGFKNRFGEKSAGEIIGFLNDYMSRMVNCIAITGGTVDKFEGDAIMACWGVLRHDSLAYEEMDPSNPEYKQLKRIHDSHVIQDALSAIKATVAMRYSLAKYNKDAEIFSKKHENEPMAKYKPHIRIGSGLNSGRATVGFMGSEDKMEFTSIGDAVNLASRTEASNKPCGTDILITEDTYNLLKKNFIRCKENNFTIKPKYEEYEVIVEVIPVTFEVKGKGKQHFYGVVNMPNFNIEEFFRKTDPNFQVDEDCRNVIGPTGPKTLHEVRTLLGIPEPDFGGVNLDEEENKIQIKTN